MLSLKLNLKIHILVGKLLYESKLFEINDINLNLKLFSFLKD